MFKKLNTVFKSITLNIARSSHLEEVKKKMGVNRRNIGMYGAAGVLIAALIIAGVAISSVMVPSLTFPGFAPNKGRLRIWLTDAPVELKHLNITIDSISAQRVENGNETWVNLTFVDEKSEVYFDLLALQNVTKELADTTLSPGNYTMIKMHVKTINATYPDDHTEDLNLPSSFVKVIVHFEIEEGGYTALLVDMNLDWIAISHSGNLRPVLKAEATVLA